MQFQTKTVFNVAHGRPIPNSSKSAWNKVGVLIVDPEKERISLHLDTIPAGDWNGWLSIFPPKEDEKGPPSRTMAAQQSTNPSLDDFDDSVPF